MMMMVWKERQWDKCHAQELPFFDATQDYIVHLTKYSPGKCFSYAPQLLLLPSSLKENFPTDLLKLSELSLFYPFKIYSRVELPLLLSLQVTNKNTLKKFPEKAWIFSIALPTFHAIRVQGWDYFAWNLLHFIITLRVHSRERLVRVEREHDITTPIWATAECVWGFSPLRKREIITSTADARTRFTLKKSFRCCHFTL